MSQIKFSCLLHDTADKYIADLKRTGYFGDSRAVNIESWSSNNIDEHKWVFIASHKKDQFTTTGLSKPQCVLLLSKMDYDPMAILSNPYMIDLIYTTKEYRRTKLACNIIKFVLAQRDIQDKNFQLVSIPDNEISDLFFESIGFFKIMSLGSNPIYYSTYEKTREVVIEDEEDEEDE